jgi:hypothetical protein
MTDMTDAQAQDAMKRAVAIDALADAELAEADQMGQQISMAAPGSAPILEAEADIWVVRANAYTQSALAELMRTRGIDLANQSKTAKLGAANGTSTNGLVTGALTKTGSHYVACLYPSRRVDARVLPGDAVEPV